MAAWCRPVVLRVWPPRPATSPSTENMLERHILGPHLKRAELETGSEAQQSVLTSPAGSSQQCGRMAVSHSVKERTISENSLIILLQGLQGQVTTVDLRDESVARGRIDNVDAFMNIRLANVTYTDRWGHQVELDDLFVTGRNVRYVHIPDDVNITATIEQQLQVIHRVRNFGGKGQGRREFPSKKYK
ncbi:U7 snRNA-associated Sm-like protein LSm10 isoform X1 [Equus caballus]|uniref:U7 snRNA-associated Sm-like protein LSm10 n=1 Tax=Equus caballus TaxID=9796 RepID=A0A9L0R5H2_HORSE|nr:U7 snRNA-associated Sm-like protein LSm10 isoform X1 [Equus caballus]XP_008515747.1 PREDICTED: U7 snRNA-associated Sm-like protein LSm10 isoform X1 [Equus przewalskii]